MTPSLKRNLLIPVPAILFVGLVYSFNKFIPLLVQNVQHLEFIAVGIMMMMALVVMLFWALLGVVAGLTSFLIAMIFLYRPLTGLDPYYYGILIVAFFMSSFIGQYIFRKINTSNQDHNVTIEKIDEDSNLVKNHLKNRSAEISAMGKKVDSLLKLKNIADRLSLSLSEEEIMGIISEETYNVFGGDNRVLLFMTDDSHKELNLSCVLKDENRKPFVPKKGSIFDKWVLSNMKSLLVKDISKDFRFSVDGTDMKDDTVSLMTKPLIIENNVLGIMRVDSPREEAYSPHELRILDIIGDLAAVAIENSRLYSQTEELAIRDSLTELYVHRYFMERIEEEVKRALRSDSSFALLMMDIDNFKAFNDKHGHIAGDAVLKNIGCILKEKVSAGDMVARYGGEEFAFLAIGHNRRQALKLAEDIRKEIEKTPVTLRREKWFVTISIGVAVFPQDAKLRNDIILEADKYLYEAKEQGKNRVCSKTK